MISFATLNLEHSKNGKLVKFGKLIPTKFPRKPVSQRRICKVCGAGPDSDDILHIYKLISFFVELAFLDQFLTFFTNLQNQFVKFVLLGQMFLKVHKLCKLFCEICNAGLYKYYKFN